MKKISQLVAFLLVLVMMTAVLAGCNGKTSDDTVADNGTTAPVDAKTYVWDITVLYSHFDVAEHGEPLPVIKLTNKSAQDHTLNIDPTTLTHDEAAMMVDDTKRLPMQTELKITTADPAAVNTLDAWTIDDGGCGASYTFEVVKPLVEGDESTHGELNVIVTAKDYVWNIEVVYESGACGTYEFINPGLPNDWEIYFGEQYLNQSFTVTPDNTTATLQIFNHQNWVVDNLPDHEGWYKWAVMDLDEEDPYIAYEIIKPLTMGDRFTPGELKITISLEPIEASGT